MEWYLWLGIYLVGILVYFGLGRFIAKYTVESLEKWVVEKAGKEFKGLPRPDVWIVTLLWPLYVAVIILGVGFCLLIIGFVIAVILSLIAIVLGLVGFVIAVILAILALALGLVPLALIAIIILSPFDGIVAIKGIVTKFNPLPWSPPEKEK